MSNWPLARVYAWGPKSGDWDQLGRWSVRWDWPFGGWPETRSSATAPAPWTTLENARRALRANVPGGLGWMLASGDDADHALLVTRHVPAATATEVVALETDRAPVDVHPPGTDAFADVEGATRISGRWYLATHQAPGELAATVVWRLDGGQARELARVPRAGIDARSLARASPGGRTDGRWGWWSTDRRARTGRLVMRWVVPVDLETGTVGDPEPLAPVDLSDRAVTFCKGEDSGWQVDLPYLGPILMHAGIEVAGGAAEPARPGAPVARAGVRGAARGRRGLRRGKRAQPADPRLARTGRDGTRVARDRRHRVVGADAVRPSMHAAVEASRHPPVVQWRSPSPFNVARRDATRAHARARFPRGASWHDACSLHRRLRGVRLPPRPLCAGTFHLRVADETRRCPGGGTVSPNS